VTLCRGALLTVGGALAGVIAVEVVRFTVGVVAVLATGAEDA
jgi:hypothetical protein